MKLKFFEKNELEREGIVVTTNDLNNSDSDSVRGESLLLDESGNTITTEDGNVLTTQASGSVQLSGNSISNIKNKNSFYKGSASSPEQRVVNKLLELVEFSDDGLEFKEKFRKTNLIRGNPERISRTTAPSRTKSISTNFQGNAITPPLQSQFRDVTGEISQSDINVSSIQYAPYISFKIGRQNLSRDFSFMEGFDDPRYDEKVLFLKRNTLKYYNDRIGSFINMTEKDIRNLDILHEEEERNLITKRVLVNGNNYDVEYEIVKTNRYYDLCFTNDNRVAGLNETDRVYSFISPMIQEIKIENFISSFARENNFNPESFVDARLENSTLTLIKQGNISSGASGDGEARQDVSFDVDGAGGNLIFTKQNNEEVDIDLPSPVISGIERIKTAFALLINFLRNNSVIYTTVEIPRIGERTIPLREGNVEYFKFLDRIRGSLFFVNSIDNQLEKIYDFIHTQLLRQIVGNLRVGDSYSRRLSPLDVNEAERRLNALPLVAVNKITSLDCDDTEDFRKLFIRGTLFSRDSRYRNLFSTEIYKNPSGFLIKGKTVDDPFTETDVENFKNEVSRVLRILPTDISNVEISLKNQNEILSLIHFRFDFNFSKISRSIIPQRFFDEGRYFTRFNNQGNITGIPNQNPYTQSGGASGGASGSASARGQQTEISRAFINFSDTNDNLEDETFLNSSITKENLGIEGNDIIFECSNYNNVNILSNLINGIIYNQELLASDSLRKKINVVPINNKFILIDTAIASSTGDIFLKSENGNEVSLNNHLPATIKTDNTIRYVIEEVIDERTTPKFLISKQLNDGIDESDSSMNECPINSITGRITFKNSESSYSQISSNEINNILLIDQNGNTKTINFSSTGTNLDNFESEISKGRVFTSNAFYSLVGNRNFKARDWLRLANSHNVRSRLKQPFKSFRIIKTSGVGAFDLLNDSNSGLETIISNLDVDFPFVKIENLQYDSDANSLRMDLSRSSNNAPVPAIDFFDSMSIRGRNFSFSSASYSSFEDETLESNPLKKRFSRYEWNSSTNPTGACGNQYQISFNKNGQSKTNEINIERFVSKSTIETDTQSVLPREIAGMEINSIDFDNLKFEIDFLNQINSNSFYSIAIKSLKGEFITREMKLSDATIVGGKVTWTNLPELIELKENKDYLLCLKKDVTSTSLRFFNTNPSGDYHFIKNIKYDNESFSFDLDSNGSKEIGESPFSNLKLLKGSDEIIQLQEFGIEREKDNFKINNIDLSSLTKGTYRIELTTSDNSPFSITFTQMIDFYFDTIILFDTNLDDIYVESSAGNPLIHSTDKLNFGEEFENNKRYIRIELENAISGHEVILKNRRFKGSSRFLGQILLFKRIGISSQYPDASVFVETSRRENKTQLNLSHIKNLPQSLSLSLSFAPTDIESDLLLAQDIFSRVANYNEFVVWLSGGELDNLKVKGMKGYRFEDLITGLCLNDFNFKYIDGRVSSGIGFDMEIKQVL